VLALHAGRCSRQRSLTDDGPDFLVIVLDGIKFCEDFDELANPPARPRPPIAAASGGRIGLSGPW
jgi:hypothetical protein